MPPEKMTRRNVPMPDPLWQGVLEQAEHESGERHERVSASEVARRYIREGLERDRKARKNGRGGR